MDYVAAQLAQCRGGRQTLALRLGADRDCHFHRDPAQIPDGGKQGRVRGAECRRLFAQRASGGQQHLIGDAAGAAGDDAQADRREYEHVVALGNRYASIAELDWYADGPAVLRLWNDTSHLAN